MAETAWTEHEAPPQKKKIPTWVWFCGGGCLAAVILGVIVIGLVFSYGKKAFDPERQWPNVAKVLPYDERPPEMHLVFGNQLGVEIYQIMDDRGYQLQLQRHTGSDGAEARKSMFQTDPPDIPTNMGVMKFEDLSLGTVEVQGRELAVVRMKLGGMMKSMAPKEAQEAFGEMMWADLTPEGDLGMTMLQVQRLRSGGPITDDELRDILKPFHVGPKR